MPAVISRYPTQDLHGKEVWVEDAGKGTLDRRAPTAGASARGQNRERQAGDGRPVPSVAESCRRGGSLVSCYRLRPDRHP